MKEIVKYRLLSLIRYLGDALFYPFFSLYLSSKGLGESAIGFILSITPIISILANPLYANLCKNVNTAKKTLSIITVIEAIIIITIAFTSNYYLLIVLTFLLAISGSSHYGLMDSVVAVYADSNECSYSSIRMFGSVAYIIGTAIGGYIIKWINYEGCFIIAAGLFIISSIAYISLKKLQVTSAVNEKIKYTSLFKNKQFVLFLILYILLNGTIYASDSFYALYLKTRGLDETKYGLVYSYFVGFEVLTIIILNIFNKKNHYKDNSVLLLIIASLSFVIRTYINYINANIIITVISSALRGLGFGIILHMSFGFVVKLVGKNKATFAIMLMSLSQAIYVALFDNIAGNIIEKSTFRNFYFITLIISLLIVIYICFWAINYKTKTMIKMKGEKI